jgi:D-alanyl-D-alanine carboxypeptidase (penicillin-binding protein 5/6)
MDHYPRQISVTTIRKYLFCLLLSLACGLLLVTPVPAQEISSRAAVVMDATTGRVLFAKNPDLHLMPASTTKLMTALVVLDHANLSAVVTVSRKASAAPATKIGLKGGENIELLTLLNAALIKSANDAAVALAEAVAGSEENFVDLMNSKAVALGLQNTRFVNSNGLPGAGQYITAFDLAEIMRQAIHYPLLKEILGTRVTEVSTGSGKTKIVRNTNHLLWSDEDLLVGKTGYTRQAGHCFVCAADRQPGPIIVALLGTPNRTLLWKETEDLMAFGTRVLNNLEESVVYVTKSDYDATMLKKASLTKKTRAKKGRTKKKRNAL